MIINTTALHGSLFLALWWSPSETFTQEPAAGFQQDEHNQCNYGKQKGSHIQAVVLIPSEVMSFNPQVFGPLIAHHILDPVDGLV